MGEEHKNPYWEQAKHIIGATLLFFLVFAVALSIDRIGLLLIDVGWMKRDGLFHWALQIAEVTLFLLDVSALLIIAAVTTYKYVRRLI